ncbi:MAG: hypothetical protein IT458_09355 [Planctomycetes bacterium]|nr:hypothetical protein [Planctomycetota bacterium]
MSGAGRRVGVMAWPALGALLAAAPRAQGPDTRPAPAWIFERGHEDTRAQGDFMEMLLTDGVRLSRGGDEIRAERAVVLFDRDRYVELLRRGQERDGTVPRRAPRPPDPRRTVDETALRARLESFLRTRPRPASRPSRMAELGGGELLEVARHLYLEGGVVVRRDGLDLVRAERVHLSTLDDRAVFEDVVLRLPTRADPDRPELVTVVRAPRLVRQGKRMVGRDVSVTTCTAGEPHFEFVSGEVEVIERGEEFEIRGRDNRIVVAGTSLVPLPDLNWFTGDQSPVPIRGASAGYSSRDGLSGAVEFGGRWNGLGGSLHEWLTGRPAAEFRGEWLLEPGWIEKRGYPVQGRLDYRAADLYRGYLRGYYLDDSGDNFREIRTYRDGRLIDTDSRALTRTENRFAILPNTTLDLTLFSSSDPAVYSEFLGAEWRSTETPETSLHLRSAVDNRIFTLTGRANLDGYSYADDLSLAPYFVEERPVATFDVFSLQLGRITDDAPILLTSSTSAGSWRRNDDDIVSDPARDASTRFDQELELATPFSLGPIGVRPFVSGRYTWYQDDLQGESLGRWAFAAGVRAGTNLSRVFEWLAQDGGRKAIRHVVSPSVLFANRFEVSEDPGQLQHYDAVDTLDERSEVRVELLQRFQSMRKVRDRRGGRDRTEVRDFLWLDLAQNLFPRADRDNAGDELGLFEYELIVRPEIPWVPLPNPRLLAEGEIDWNAGEQRTFNTGLAFGPVAGIDWNAEYRWDQVSKGVIGYGASAKVLGRWVLGGGSQYDIERSEALNYAASLIREDHDWRIRFELSYDRINDETSFTVNFEPTLGGLVRPRGDRYVGSDRLAFQSGADY